MSIEERVAGLVREALGGAFGLDDPPAFEVTAPKLREHGDLSVAAMVFARSLRMKPMEIADRIVEHLPSAPWIRKVEVVPPGYVNFHLSHEWMHDAVREALERGADYGTSEEGRGASVNVEFVSINPTGPLHIGAARNAALGDAIARLLEATGHRVTREYYFNDAGRQMELFGESVAARYLELLGRPSTFPADGYHGTYVTDLARVILETDGDAHAGDPDLASTMRELAYPIVIGWIEDVLDRFRIHFDVWFKERTLVETGKAREVIERLREAGYVYEKDGATWLGTEDLGDARGERVLVKSDGYPTYLATDLAYHLDKAGRGFRLMIDVWGADHHGQVPSLAAGLRALGIQPEQLEVIVYQWVHLQRGGEPVGMSKRAGNFLTLTELLDEVGTDAARYTLLRTSAEHDMTFDIEEVKAQSQENPVYYVQYAHARIASILRKAGATDVTSDELALLTEEAEVELMRAVAGYPDVVRISAHARTPYRLARHAEDLARAFHRFYTDCRVIGDDPSITRARLALCAATERTLANALGLLGVGAPERMERDDELG